MRDEVNKCEVKFQNERQERLKLSDKKSLEIAEIEAQSKIYVESMKSERDFITRELELAKEALRKKDRRIKELLGDSAESPNKRLKIDSPNYYSPGFKRSRLNTKVKTEHGAIPRSIDR